MLNDFMATGFSWFLGVVEDVNDPAQMNRVRVRCFGYHTADKAKVATEDLPWATVMLPTTSAGISGLGSSPHALVNGSWVFGFFRDGTDAQDPIIMGSLSSSYAEKPSDTNVGFVDPTGEYPVTQGTEETFVDVNINARGTNNIVDKIDGVINNPPSAYASVYPNNKVTQTTSGHIIEVDDTEGAERIKVYHKSGTFVEFHPNGDIVQSNENRWQITTGNDKAHVTGNVEIHIDGTATVNCPTTNWTGNINLDGNINITGVSTAEGDHVSAGVSGKGHTHNDTKGLGANTTSKPN